MTTLKFRHNANTEKYEKVYVFGKPMLFTDNRIDKSTLPPGWHLYEVSYDDDNVGNPDCISNRIIANFLGSLVSTTDLGNIEDYMTLDCYNDWKWTGEFLYPSKGDKV